MPKIGVIMRYLLFFILILFIGCQSSQKPTILDSKAIQEYANNIVNPSTKKDTNKELEIKKEIALIDMKKEIESKKIEAKAKIEAKKIEKAKELQKAKIQLQAKEDAIKINKIAIIALLIFGFAFLWILYFLFKKQQENKIFLEQEKLRNQKELKEMELKAKMAEKFIDAISSNNLTKEQEEKLLALINHKNILEK